MATRKQNSHPRRRKPAKSNTLPESAERQLVKADAGTPDNTQIAQPPAVRKRNYVRKAPAMAAAAKPNPAQVESLPVQPVPAKASPGAMVMNNGGGSLSTGNSIKKNRLSVLALALSGFLILFVLFFCVIPLKQVNYLSPVVYQDVETYTDQEAYLEAIPYTEKEAFTVQQPYTENQAYVVSQPYVDYDHHYWPHTDNVTPPPPPPQPTIRYRDVVTYIPVTKYRTVTEYRDVQKVKYELRYRPVQKQRTVTKVKQEPRTKTVPMLYYLMSDSRTIDMMRSQS